MAPGGRDDVLGPVQVLLIGIDEHSSDRMLAAELQDLRTQDGIRVLDVLRMRRGLDDEVRRLEPLDPVEHAGALVEALLVADGEERDPHGAPPHPRATIGEGDWFLVDRVPRGSAAAILLIEHRWAIPLREAAAEFEAEIFGDAWVHPRDLEAAMRAVAGGRDTG